MINNDLPVVVTVQSTLFSMESMLWAKPVPFFNVCWAETHTKSMGPCFAFLTTYPSAKHGIIIVLISFIFFMANWAIYASLLPPLRWFCGHFGLDLLLQFTFHILFGLGRLLYCRNFGVPRVRYVNDDTFNGDPFRSHNRHCNWGDYLILIIRHWFGNHFFDDVFLVIWHLGLTVDEVHVTWWWFGGSGVLQSCIDRHFFLW